MHLAAIAFVGVLVAPPGYPAPQDATARALLSAWKDQDPSGRLAAELIAGAFASGLSWGGRLRGKEVFCPPDRLTGRQKMSAFERFVADTPDMADKPYGVAMAESLRSAFPCQALEVSAARGARPPARIVVFSPQAPQSVREGRGSSRRRTRRSQSACRSVRWL